MASKSLKYALLNFAALPFKLFRINMLLAAYKNMGILRYENSQLSGEDFFVGKVLPQLLPSQGIVFDVGANEGNYALSLQQALPQAQIYAFEPVPNTYQKLLAKTKDLSKVKIFNFGLSSENSSAQIYTYASDTSGEHSSLYSEVVQSIHGATQIAINIELRQLDQFCQDQGIDHIDFLKIDTEGHELDVLKGAKRLIEQQKIQVIQFEFNEMNIVSRVFLKDFYDILPNYHFYRLHSKRLMPLGKYDSMNEIFQFQNIIAIPAALENKVRGFCS